jgi:hypothetical protein
MGFIIAQKIATSIRPFLIPSAIGIVLMIMMIVIVFMHVHITDGNKVFSGIVGGLGILYVGLSTLVYFTPTNILGGDSHGGDVFGFNAMKVRAQEAAARVKAQASALANSAKAEATALADSAKAEAMLATQNATSKINANVATALESVDKVGTMGAFE